MSRGVAVRRPGAGGGAAPTRREIRGGVPRALMIVLGLGAIDQSIVATALPRIVDATSAASATCPGWSPPMSWHSTATMPLYGKLSDQQGAASRCCYAAILIFLLGSALCGPAPDAWSSSSLFRAVQGSVPAGCCRSPRSSSAISCRRPERGRQRGRSAAVVRRLQHDRPGARRPDHRPLVLALDLLRQPAGSGRSALAVASPRALPSRTRAASAADRLCSARLLLTDRHHGLPAGPDPGRVALALVVARDPRHRRRHGAASCLVLFVRACPARAGTGAAAACLFGNRLFARRLRGPGADLHGPAAAPACSSRCSSRW